MRMMMMMTDKADFREYLSRSSKPAQAKFMMWYFGSRARVSPPLIWKRPEGKEEMS